MPLERVSGKAAAADDARVRTPVMLEAPEGENRVSSFAVVHTCLPSSHSHRGACQFSP